MDVKFEYLYFETREKSHYQDIHSHHSHELVYYIRGRGVTEMGGDSFTYGEGMFSYVPPECPHSRIHIDETEFLAIGYLHNMPVSVAHGVYCDADSTIRRLLEEIRQELMQKRNLYRIRLDALTAEVVVALERMINAGKKEKESDWISFARNYMDVHYNEKLDMRSLAGSTFYSYDYFRHAFKELTGFSPNGYIMMKRLESAKEKLLRSDACISDISMACGFSTPAQFCHLFRKYTSMTPLQYRKTGD